MKEISEKVKQEVEISKDASNLKKKFRTFRIIRILISVLTALLNFLLFIAIVALVIFVILSIISALIGITKNAVDSSATVLGINTSGSGEIYDNFDNLYNVYGESSCSFLEPFNDKHDYVVMQGIESDNIYSLASGEVIYINDSAKNLSDNYDFKTNKCLCSGIMCDNYNGNEIKIKFEVDGYNYIAIYSNLSSIFVKKGDLVKEGDLIGIEGNTGCTNIKKLTLRIEDEKGNSYNPDFMKKCSSMINTLNACDFKNIVVNFKENNINFYEYIKQELYKNFKNSLDNEEVLKAETIMLATKFLKENNYVIEKKEFNISYYEEVNINESDSKKLNRAINDVLGQVLTYGGNFANIKYSNTCTRGEYDKNVNSIYNEFCVLSALNMNKTYDELLKIYFPNFVLSKNFCYDYASEINEYKIDYNKKILNNEISIKEKEKLNLALKTKIERVGINTRAATVEAARFLVLGLNYKISYKNGSKFFEIGINEKWNIDGLDSSGFVSWALHNGGAKIEKSLNINEIINNTVGNIKINQDLYNYFDQVQVGDIAYQSGKVGIIIGKMEGTLYVAECDLNNGLIVSKITSYGETESNYTNIYFADDYYLNPGKITNMW